MSANGAIKATIIRIGVKSAVHAGSLNSMAIAILGYSENVSGDTNILIMIGTLIITLVRNAADNVSNASKIRVTAVVNMSIPRKKKGNAEFQSVRYATSTTSHCRRNMVRYPNTLVDHSWAAHQGHSDRRGKRNNPICQSNKVRIPGIRGCRQNEVGSNTRGFSRGQYQFGEAV